MKRKIFKFILILLFLSCVLIALFPSASKIVTGLKYETEANEFIESVENKSIKAKNKKIDIDRLYRDSSRYNKNLMKEQLLTDDFYLSALSLSDYGINNDVYGYIKIPKINLTLPIYLGATDYNMSRGAAHLMHTSLPLDQNSTNCVLAAHTGYLGKNFFDYIPNLSKGDKIQISTYFDTINYTIKSTKVVNSGVTGEFYIEKDKKELILVTCANNGHDRFVVIAEII